MEFIDRQPADLAELPLERRRDRRGHHVRARAGILRGDLDRREIDRRQRGDRQQRVAEQAPCMITPAMSSEVAMGRRMKGSEMFTISWASVV